MLAVDAQTPECRNESDLRTGQLQLTPRRTEVQHRLVDQHRFMRSSLAVLAPCMSTMDSVYNILARPMDSSKTSAVDRIVTFQRRVLQLGVADAKPL